MSTSPARKAQTHARRRLLWLAVLSSLWFCCLGYLLLARKVPPQVLELQALEHRVFNESLSLGYSSYPGSQDLPDQTLGVIVPVTYNSVLHLESVLLPLTNHSLRISLVCSRDILQKARHALRGVLFSSEDVKHVEFVLHPWVKGSSYVATALAASSSMTGGRILFLTEHGLGDLDAYTRDVLISSPAYPLPYGPRGFDSFGNPIYPISQTTHQPASFLLPPFIVPLYVLHGTPRTHLLKSWKAFGDAVSEWTGDGIGGIVLAADKFSLRRPEVSLQTDAVHDVSTSINLMDQLDTLQANSFVQNSSSSDELPSGLIALFLPNLDDLRDVSPFICRLQENGIQIHIFLYERRLDDHFDGSQSSVLLGDCSVRYRIGTHGEPFQTVTAWLQRIPSIPDIVITISEDDSFTRIIRTALSSHPYSHSILIRLPRRDLQHCDWMGLLTIEELRNWHSPLVDVTVITNDRPHSLVRLLASLDNARYFGDVLNLRINLEQNTDAETLYIVDKMRWDHGAKFVNHRVIHGGLLPAVVESWYPHSDHSYGLILEDDVELSPLFYAWVKMTLLRYRYGKQEDKSAQMFGISLYQQKNVETKPGGRQSFNARTVFAAENLATYNTPYLSQIPCSWGAIYFPEHWREFHSYLAVRLSEFSLSINQVVVPDARSNRWTRSWKKYFIELAYLRGYVMLYPNYNHFNSLSTNHLEFGSHVKDISMDSHMQKKELFLVPLMPLSKEGLSMLLDLPEKGIPQYASLPTLDLFGDMVSTPDSLIERGLSRQAELFPSCRISASIKKASRFVFAHDVRDLFCLE